MNNVTRLSIALVLAVLAGIGNYAWMTWMTNKNKEYVTVKEPIKINQVIKEGDLDKVRIHGDQEKLKKTFVLAEKGQSLLVGLRATRDYEAGDLFQHSQISSELPRWKALGSFRLISVGDRVRTGDRYSDGRGSSSITIAVKVDDNNNYEPIAERLLDLIAVQSERDKQPGMTIVAIQVDEAAGLSEPDDMDFDNDQMAITLDENEKALIVPLGNVESIPEVLVRGDKISFVVAWYDDTAESNNEATENP